MVTSIFEEIPGMGKKRIEKLWKEFSSLQEIQKTSLKEIELKTGFSKKICKKIKLQFNKNNS